MTLWRKASSASKGTVWSGLRSGYRIQDESKPGTFTWVNWGKMSFKLLDNSGKKSHSHFLELMRKWHEAQIPPFFILLNWHTYLFRGLKKRKLAIDIWPHQKVGFRIVYSSMRVKAGKSTGFILMQLIGIQQQQKINLLYIFPVLCVLLLRKLKDYHYPQGNNINV